VNLLKEECRCGHDKATHFEKSHACLAAMCVCSKYRDANVPPAPTSGVRLATPKVKLLYRFDPNVYPPGRPHVNPNCMCDKCTQFDMAEWGI